MTTIDKFVYPGQFIFEDVVYFEMNTTDQLKDIKEKFEFDPSDLVIASYPKTGTTWTEELVYSTSVGLEKSKSRTQCMDQIFFFLETSWEGMGYDYETIKSTPPPRRIKTHLKPSFFHRQLNGESPCPKFIVPLRNPKDTLVSFYFDHLKAKEYYQFDYTFSEYFQLFAEKRLLQGDCIDLSVGWWKYRDHPNVLILFYEDMLLDGASAVGKIAKFLAKSLPEEETSAISDYASFSKMKARGRKYYVSGDDDVWGEEPISFFRKGIAGGWREHFTEEECKFVDERIKQECEPVGLCFKE